MADFNWLCRSTQGPRFEVCQVGLGSSVTFLNGYTKDLSQSPCDLSGFLDEEVGKPSISDLQINL